jgi:hypothetical protein
MSFQRLVPPSLRTIFVTFVGRKRATSPQLLTLTAFGSLSDGQSFHRFSFGSGSVARWIATGKPRRQRTGVGWFIFSAGHRKAVSANIPADR